MITGKATESAGQVPSCPGKAQFVRSWPATYSRAKNMLRLAIFLFATAITGGLSVGASHAEPAVISGQGEWRVEYDQIVGEGIVTDPDFESDTYRVVWVGFLLPGNYLVLNGDVLWRSFGTTAIYRVQGDSEDLYAVFEGPMVGWVEVDDTGTEIVHMAQEIQSVGGVPATGEVNILGEAIGDAVNGTFRLVVDVPDQQFSPVIQGPHPLQSRQCL